MEEKVLIKGNAQSLKLIPVIVIIIGTILGIGVSSLFLVPPLDSETYMLPVPIIGGFILIVWGIVLLFYVNNCEICVTDKRIYGKAVFGVRVDIPVDSVSSVGTMQLFKGVSVASASGRIKFLYISNAEEIHKVISDILINRQRNSGRYTPAAQNTDTVDRLKKYKELLDSGVITQEEFDAKKKELLNM